jgi:hypothetical protein
MTKRKDTRARAGDASKKRDPLALYREQAVPIIRLCFSNSTPAFLRDLLGSWLTVLENELQVFWNRREVLEIALPIMLAEADAQGLDVFSVSGGVFASALRESLDCSETGEAIKREPTEREVLERELRREADAFSVLIHSKHLPEDVRINIAEAYDYITDGYKDEPDAVRVAYVAAVHKLKAAGEGGN